MALQPMSLAATTTLGLRDESHFTSLHKLVPSTEEVAKKHLWVKEWSAYQSNQGLHFLMGQTEGRSLSKSSGHFT